MTLSFTNKGKEILRKRDNKIILSNPSGKPIEGTWDADKKVFKLYFEAKEFPKNVIDLGSKETIWTATTTSNDTFNPLGNIVDIEFPLDTLADIEAESPPVRIKYLESSGQVIGENLFRELSAEGLLSFVNRDSWYRYFRYNREADGKNVKRLDDLGRVISQDHYIREYSDPILFAKGANLDEDPVAVYGLSRDIRKIQLYGMVTEKTYRVIGEDKILLSTEKVSIRNVPSVSIEVEEMGDTYNVFDSVEDFSINISQSGSAEYSIRARASFYQGNNQIYSNYLYLVTAEAAKAFYPDTVFFYEGDIPVLIFRYNDCKDENSFQTLKINTIFSGLQLEKVFYKIGEDSEITVSLADITNPTLSAIDAEEEEEPIEEEEEDPQDEESSEDETAEVLEDEYFYLRANIVDTSDGSDIYIDVRPKVENTSEDSWMPKASGGTDRPIIREISYGTHKVRFILVIAAKTADLVVRNSETGEGTKTVEFKNKEYIRSFRVTSNQGDVSPDNYFPCWSAIDNNFVVHESLYGNLEPLSGEAQPGYEEEWSYGTYFLDKDQEKVGKDIKQGGMSDSGYPTITSIDYAEYTVGSTHSLGAKVWWNEPGSGSSSVGDLTEIQNEVSNPSGGQTGSYPGGTGSDRRNGKDTSSSSSSSSSSSGSGSQSGNNHRRSGGETMTDTFEDEFNNPDYDINSEYSVNEDDSDSDDGSTKTQIYGTIRYRSLNPEAVVVDTNGYVTCIAPYGKVVEIRTNPTTGEEFEVYDKNGGAVIELFASVNGKPITKYVYITVRHAISPQNQDNLLVVVDQSNDVDSINEASLGVLYLVGNTGTIEDAKEMNGGLSGADWRTVVLRPFVALSLIKWSEDPKIVSNFVSGTVNWKGDTVAKQREVLWLQNNNIELDDNIPGLEGSDKTIIMCMGLARYLVEITHNCPVMCTISSEDIVFVNGQRSMLLTNTTKPDYLVFEVLRLPENGSHEDYGSTYIEGEEEPIKYFKWENDIITISPYGVRPHGVVHQVYPILCKAFPALSENRVDHIWRLNRTGSDKLYYTSYTDNLKPELIISDTALNGIIVSAYDSETNNYWRKFNLIGIKNGWEEERFTGGKFDNDNVRLGQIDGIPFLSKPAISVVLYTDKEDTDPEEIQEQRAIKIAPTAVFEGFAWTLHRCPKCGRSYNYVPTKVDSWGEQSSRFKTQICPECGTTMKPLFEYGKRLNSIELLDVSATHIPLFKDVLMSPSTALLHLRLADYDTKSGPKQNLLGSSASQEITKGVFANFVLTLTPESLNTVSDIEVKEKWIQYGVGGVGHGSDPDTIYDVLVDRDIIDAVVRSSYVITENVYFDGPSRHFDSPELYLNYYNLPPMSTGWRGLEHTAHLAISDDGSGDNKTLRIENFAWEDKNGNTVTLMTSNIKSPWSVEMCIKSEVPLTEVAYWGDPRVRQYHHEFENVDTFFLRFRWQNKYKNPGPEDEGYIGSVMFRLDPKYHKDFCNTGSGIAINDDAVVEELYHEPDDVITIILPIFYKKTYYIDRRTHGGRDMIHYGVFGTFRPPFSTGATTTVYRVFGKEDLTENQQFSCVSTSMNSEYPSPRTTISYDFNTSDDITFTMFPRFKLSKTYTLTNRDSLLDVMKKAAGKLNLLLVKHNGTQWTGEVVDTWTYDQMGIRECIVVNDRVFMGPLGYGSPENEYVINVSSSTEEVALYIDYYNISDLPESGTNKETSSRLKLSAAAYYEAVGDEELDGVSAPEFDGIYEWLADDNRNITITRADNSYLDRNTIIHFGENHNIRGRKRVIELTYSAIETVAYDGGVGDASSPQDLARASEELDHQVLIKIIQEQPKETVEFVDESNTYIAASHGAATLVFRTNIEYNNIVVESTGLVETPKIQRWGTVDQQGYSTYRASLNFKANTEYVDPRTLLADQKWYKEHRVYVRNKNIPLSAYSESQVPDDESGYSVVFKQGYYSLCPVMICPDVEGTGKFIYPRYVDGVAILGEQTNDNTIELPEYRNSTSYLDRPVVTLFGVKREFIQEENSPEEWFTQEELLELADKEDEGRRLLEISRNFRSLYSFAADLKDRKLLEKEWFNQIRTDLVTEGYKKSETEALAASIRGELDLSDRDFSEQFSDIYPGLETIYQAADPGIIGGNVIIQENVYISMGYLDADRKSVKIGSSGDPIMVENKIQIWYRKRDIDTNNNE